MKRIVWVAVCAMLSVPAYAQTPRPFTLWSVYLSAGANAAVAENWAEAEMFFSAAMHEAEQSKPGEPFRSIASYSLATTYYKQGRTEAASNILRTPNRTIDPHVLGAELERTQGTLGTLGYLFYSQAEKDSKELNSKELTGEALTSKQAEILAQYEFARQYYEWAVLLEKQVRTPHSPELEDSLTFLGLSCYNAREYKEAIATFKELQAIEGSIKRRNDALSHDSIKYSLSAKSTAESFKQSLDAGSIAVLISGSYFELATEVKNDKPQEAIEELEQAETSLRDSTSDPEMGYKVRMALANEYMTHAEVLRSLKHDAQADRLEAKAKSLILEKGK